MCVVTSFLPPCATLKSDEQMVHLANVLPIKLIMFCVVYCAINLLPFLLFTIPLKSLVQLSTKWHSLLDFFFGVEFAASAC